VAAGPYVVADVEDAREVPVRRAEGIVTAAFELDGGGAVEAPVLPGGRDDVVGSEVAGVVEGSRRGRASAFPQRSRVAGDRAEALRVEAGDRPSRRSWK